MSKLTNEEKINMHKNISCLVIAVLFVLLLIFG